MATHTLEDKLPCLSHTCSCYAIWATDKMQDGQTVTVNLGYQPHSYSLHFPKGLTGTGEMKEDGLILNTGLEKRLICCLWSDHPEFCKVLLLKENNLGAGEMAQWLGTLAEDPDAIPVKTWWLQPSVTPVGIHALFWSPWVPSVHMVHIHTFIHLGKTFTQQNK